MKEKSKSKLDELDKIAVLNPQEIEEFTKKYPVEYYKKLNEKYFKEVPDMFWRMLFDLVGNDWLEFFKFVSNPRFYTPLGSGALAYRYLQKMREALGGWKNFNEDFQVMFGIKSPEGFKVGKDIAAMPKETIFQSPLLNLYRYKSDKPGGPPILFVYSYINGYYILDLTPGKSLVEHFVKAGFDVFITDWQKPTNETKLARLDDYLGGIFNAVELVRGITHSPQIGALGYCIGGTLLDIIVALYPRNFRYLINLTSGLDTQVGEDGMGPFGAFTDLELINLKEFLKMNGGVFPAYMMNFFFDAVKPEKKAEQVYESYFHGKELKPDPVLFWNAESSRDVPGPAHYEFLEEIYNKNSLANGEMEVLEHKVDLKCITCPYCNVVARFDHIVPMPIGLQNSFLIGTPFDMQKAILIQGGHVRGVVNPELFPILSHFAQFACLGF